MDDKLKYSLIQANSKSTTMQYTCMVCNQTWTEKYIGDYRNEARSFDADDIWNQVKGYVLCENCLRLSH